MSDVTGFTPETALHRFRKREPPSSVYQLPKSKMTRTWLTGTPAAAATDFRASRIISPTVLVAVDFRSPSAPSLKSGHNYWNHFDSGTQQRIEDIGREVHDLMFKPTMELPAKTLDLPVAGQGYGPHVLPFTFDLVNVCNRVGVADSSNKSVKDDGLTDDPTEDRQYRTWPKSGGFFGDSVRITHPR